MKELTLFWLVFYLTWELMINETRALAGQGLILCQVNGRTVSTRRHCVCPSQCIVCEGILYFHVCKSYNVKGVCSVFPEPVVVHFLPLGPELVLEMPFRHPLCMILSTCIVCLFPVPPLMDLPFLSYRSAQQLPCPLT